VKHAKTYRKPNCHEDKSNQRHCYWMLVHGKLRYYPVVRGIGLSTRPKKQKQRVHEYKYAKRSGYPNEKGKQTIISQPNACPYLRTMVIKALNTIITNGAMKRSWRSEYLTSTAKLKPDSRAVCTNILESGRNRHSLRLAGTAVNILISWNDAGISKGGL